MLDIFSLPSPPRDYSNFLDQADKFLAKSWKFIGRTQGAPSKKNLQSVPSNATIRPEHVKCGKSLCLGCPHGPYYYAYWKENGKLKKKYIGTKHEVSWKKQSKTVPNR
jgi:TPP-dependent indolepyruvate ferredoxin oxidoreductase alpha subunit